MNTDLVPTTPSYATPANTAATYSRISDPLAFAEKMALSASSIMKAPVEQGMAIALHALSEGLSLVEMRRRYHWIGGGPTMRADAMLAEFRMNHGGDYKVVQRDAEGVMIEFTDRAGRTYPQGMTWAEAQESRWPWKEWQDHSKGLKDNWATPIDRRAMMFARVVSDSIRFICPELAAGVYTPEEAMDIVDSLPAAPQPPRPTASDALAASRTAHAPLIQPPVGQPVEEPAPEPVAADDGVVEQAEAPAAGDPGSITTAHAARIQELFDTLQLKPAKIEEILAKRNAKVVRNLSDYQACQIIDRLEAIEKQQRLGE